MSSKGRQQTAGGLGRELAVALEGSVAAGKDAAVQAAERACHEAREAARETREAARAAGELRERIGELLERHAAETSRVVGRGVLCCACIALLELAPLLVLLWVVLLC